MAANEQLVIDYTPTYQIVLDVAGTIAVVHKQSGVAHYLPYTKNIVWLFMLSQSPVPDDQLCGLLFDNNLSTSPPS